MVALLTAFVIGAGLATILAVAYSVPIRRTWRKEHDEPLNIPGPEAHDRERYFHPGR
ncbi:MAG: hypothetical protein R3F62_10765 [Planctomycetota bacterium]